MLDDLNSRVILRLTDPRGEEVDLESLCVDADYKVALSSLGKILRYDEQGNVDGFDYVLNLSFE